MKAGITLSFRTYASLGLSIRSSKETCILIDCVLSSDMDLVAMVRTFLDFIPFLNLRVNPVSTFFIQIFLQAYFTRYALR